MKTKDYKKDAIRKLHILVVSIFAINIISHFLISLNFVEGNSMKPFVCNNGIVLTQRGNYELKRFDIVIANVPGYGSSHRQMAVKRVIAIPYDFVQIKQGFIYVNGEIIDDYNYYTVDAGLLEKEMQLKENEYILIGDNRDVSYDSRFYGPVSCEYIKGKVIKVLYKG